MKKVDDAQTNIFRSQEQYPGELKLLAGLVRPGMRVLDVGTAATGRSAILLRSLGAEVYSIDINLAAIVEFSRQGDPAGIRLAAADLCRLPFVDSYFDLVLIAFHGFDYLLTDEQRIRAFREVSRILTPSGVLVFNSFNRLGALLSPRSFFSFSSLFWKVKHVCTGRFFRSTLIDQNYLELHQDFPRVMIRLVHKETDLRFSHAINLNGSAHHLFLLTLFAAAPYYVFSRESACFLKAFSSQ